MAATSATRWQIASRVAASLLGSYAFVWGLVMLGMGLCLQAGMAYGDAIALAALYAFVVFLGECAAGVVRAAGRWRVDDGHRLVAHAPERLN
jgi:hypothetical protein